MIKINAIQTYGWEAAMRGMRNPKNSWAMTDSSYFGPNELPLIGEKDMKLMQILDQAGTDHSKFERMITVTCDILAPLYWWKEFDTYKVGTVADSCSTMHKIQAKKFTLDDFSHEHLEDIPLNCLTATISNLNFYRDRFNEHNNKNDWWQMIQLLPTSYNQLRTVQMNYQVVKHMLISRKGHKLDEWNEFREIMIMNLPYFSLITGINE